MNDLLNLYCVVVAAFVGAVSFIRLSMLDEKLHRPIVAAFFAFGLLGSIYSLLWPSLAGAIFLSSLAIQYIASWQLWAGECPPPFTVKKK